MGGIKTQFTFRRLESRGKRLFSQKHLYIYVATIYEKSEIPTLHQKNQKKCKKSPFLAHNETEQTRLMNFLSSLLSLSAKEII